MKKRFKTTELDELIVKHVGKKGSKKRDDFEEELGLEILGTKINEHSNSKNLTQKN